MEQKFKMSEADFQELCKQWEKSPKSKDKKYLSTPEGKLMQAIYGKKKE